MIFVLLTTVNLLISGTLFGLMVLTAKYDWGQVFGIAFAVSTACLLFTAAPIALPLVGVYLLVKGSGAFAR